MGIISGGGGGGGFATQGVVIESTGVDVSQIGLHPTLFTTLYDNTIDFNELTSIPSGLGLVFLFDGTFAALATTAAGVWAFSALVQLHATDATYRGAFGIGYTGGAVPLSAPTADTQTVQIAETDRMPSGASNGSGVYVETFAAATAATLTVVVELQAVRIA